jgi:16S rRNA (uracil1498-N3)-methyltransferase
MKQSGQSFLPLLHPLTPLEEFISSSPPQSDLLIAHCCEQEDPARKHLYDILSQREVIILIGPEGDFSGKEITTALQAGYRTITMGNTRLRTETAGIAAALITAVKYRNS